VKKSLTISEIHYNYGLRTYQYVNKLLPNECRTGKSQMNPKLEARKPSRHWNRPASVLAEKNQDQNTRSVLQGRTYNPKGLLLRGAESRAAATQSVLLRLPGRGLTTQLGDGIRASNELAPVRRAASAAESGSAQGEESRGRQRPVASGCQRQRLGCYASNQTYGNERFPAGCPNHRNPGGCR